MLDRSAKGEGSTSQFYPAFQSFFEASEIGMAFWHPTLRALGRAQLDLLHLRARQARAFMAWGSEIARPQPPLELLAANMRFFQTLTEQNSEYFEILLSALSPNSQSAPVADAQATQKRRDTIVLPPRGDEAQGAGDRQVA